MCTSYSYTNNTNDVPVWTTELTVTLILLDEVSWRDFYVGSFYEQEHGFRLMISIWRR
jgi:hypothetical protein